MPIGKEGQCFINRRSPDAINTYGWRYDFTAQRRISLQNHHGLEFYFNGYGQFYPRHHDYDENTVKLYGGYSFRNAKTEITAAPILEYSTFGDHRYYHGWGTHLEWTQNISPRHSWNTQFEYKNCVTASITVHLIKLMSVHYSVLGIIYLLRKQPYLPAQICHIDIHRTIRNPTVC
ncbi:Protein of uncharacterised function (DUF560) [Rodentibacter pneumotropicus]|uniref:Protein of uncharacterized function (DUF560) n=1 Tax=Rodentibacter pneumotropicus TaxID=758 RepID=A0A3S5ERY4_9PAST|nr:Protein of uncharacterised function (DUF560) [Rodentibacter pneumotropicus]